HRPRWLRESTSTPRIPYTAAVAAARDIPMRAHRHGSPSAAAPGPALRWHLGGCTHQACAGWAACGTGLRRTGDPWHPRGMGAAGGGRDVTTPAGVGRGRRGGIDDVNRGGRCPPYVTPSAGLPIRRTG